MVVEVFETYIPGYKVHSQETLADPQVNPGSQLASSLIEEFRIGISEGSKDSRQLEVSDAQKNAQIED